MHMVTFIEPVRGFVVVLLLHAVAPVLGQSLERTELLPEVGATWHMRALQSIPQMPRVVRPVVWPFAHLEGNDVFGIAYTMYHADDVPLADAYPEVDRVLHARPDDGGAATNVLLDVGPNRCLEVVSATPAVTQVYDPSALVMAFPLAFGTPVEADHCFMSVSPSSLSSYCGTTGITYLNTGLLQLPFGEFPEAHLVRTVQTNVNEVEPMDSTIAETHTWYANGMPYPLLRLTTMSYSDGTQAHEGYILDPTSVVGIVDRSTMYNLPLWPIPSTGEVSIESPSAGVLRVHASDGRLVHTERITAEVPVRMDLSYLDSGTYRAVLSNGQRTWSAPLILAH